MPRWEQDGRPPGPIVQGFSGRGFSVDGVVYEGVRLTPERAEAWTAPPVAELGIAEVEALLALEPVPEFLILGTGRAMAFPPRAFIRAVEERGIGIEVMDSRAAARSWGMLRGEHRWIVAAIMPLA